MSSQFIYISITLLYVAVIFYVGWAYSKKTKNSDDFMIGGHDMGWFLTLCAFAATWVSATSMIGGPGFLFRWGYSYMLYGPIAWFIGSATPMIALAYKLRRSPTKTVPEFMSKRYGSVNLQAFSALIMVYGFILYVVIQMKGFAIIMSAMLDLPYSWGVWLVAIMVLYTTVLGFKSVAATDVVNFACLTFGAVIGAIVILNLVGGFSAMNAKAALIDTVPMIKEGAKIAATIPGALLHPTSMGTYTPLYFFGIFLAMGLGGAASPQYAVRMLAAKNVKIAVYMAGLSVLLMSVVYFSTTVIGIGSRVLIPTLPAGTDQDWIYPLLAVKYMYPAIGALILVGIAAAAVSTANAQLLLVATSTIYDIYRNLFDKNMPEAKLLKWTKIAVFLTGILCMIITLSPPPVILQMGAYVWGLFGAVFFIPLWGGCYWKRATRQGAIASVVGGAVVYLVWDLTIGAKPTHPVVFGMLASLILFIVVSKLTPPMDKKFTDPYFTEDF